MMVCELSSIFEDITCWIHNLCLCLETRNQGGSAVTETLACFSAVLTESKSWCQEVEADMRKAQVLMSVEEDWGAHVCWGRLKCSCLLRKAQVIMSIAGSSGVEEGDMRCTFSLKKELCTLVFTSSNPPQRQITSPTTAQLSHGLGDSRSEEVTISTPCMLLARISAYYFSLMEWIVCLSYNNVTITQARKLDDLLNSLHLSVWISKHSLRCVLALKVQEPELCIRKNKVCMCKICRGFGNDFFILLMAGMLFIHAGWRLLEWSS